MYWGYFSKKRLKLSGVTPLYGILYVGVRV